MKTTSFILGLFLTVMGSFSQAATFPPVDAEGMQEYEKTIRVKNFHGVDITIACELYVRQGDDESLRIEADKDIFDKLQAEVRDSILYLESDKERNYKDWD